MHAWRRAIVCGSMVLFGVAGGCGRAVPGAAPRPSWKLAATWGSTFLTASTPLGKRYGPLAATLTNTQLVIADSFRERLLVWTLRGRRWSGPRVIQLPRKAPIVAVAASPTPPNGIAAAEADGEIWWTAGAPRLIADLASNRGAMVVVTGLAIGPQGRVWVDETAYSADGTRRSLWAVDAAKPSPDPPRRMASTRLAGPAGAADASGLLGSWLVLPPGQRQAIATGPRQTVWVVGGGDREPRLFQLSTEGRPGPGRRLPPAGGPSDFLGVGPRRAAYFVVSTGPATVRLGVVTASGRLRWSLSLDCGAGPFLGQYAVVAPNGAMALLNSGHSGLGVRWYAPKTVSRWW